MRKLGLTLFLAIFYSLCWLALWSISFYLTQNGQQAMLLLPQGLRLALMTLLSRRYWPAMLLSEAAIGVCCTANSCKPTGSCCCRPCSA